MGWVGVALSLVGGIMGAQGQRQEGRDARAAEEYNAGVLRANAEAIRKSNEYDVYGINKAKRRFLSNQQALYAKSGVRSGEGSPLEVMIDTATQFELEKMMSKYNAEVGIAQNQNEATQREYLGKLSELRGNQRASQTLLSTAGSMAGSYGGGAKTGGFQFGSQSTAHSFGSSIR